MKSGLIIFNTLAVTLRTDNAGHWTQDTGRRTHDIVPPLPYTISSRVSLKMVRNIFYKGKTSKIDNNITDIKEINGCIDVSMHCFCCF